MTRVGVYPTPTASAGAERRILRCVRMNVYLFTVPTGCKHGEGADRVGRDGVPGAGRAVDPVGNFFARVRCDHIQYHDTDSNSGYLLVVDGYDLLQSHEGLPAEAGGNRFVVVQLKDFLSDIVKRGTLKNGKVSRPGERDGRPESFAAVTRSPSPSPAART